MKRCLQKQKLLKLVRSSDASSGRKRNDHTFVGCTALTKLGTGVVLADRIDGMIEVDLGSALKISHRCIFAISPTPRITVYNLLFETCQVGEEHILITTLLLSNLVSLLRPLGGEA